MDGTNQTVTGEGNASRKQKITEVEPGIFQLRKWNAKAQEWDSTDIDVRDFEEKYICHPAEAQTFYPEQFVNLRIPMGWEESNHTSQKSLIP